MLCPSGRRIRWTLAARPGVAGRRRTPHRPLGRPSAPDAALPDLLPIVRHQVRGAAWMDGTARSLCPVQPRIGQFNLEWLALIRFDQRDDPRGAVDRVSLAFWLWFRPTRRWAILGGLPPPSASGRSQHPGIRRDDDGDLPDVPDATDEPTSCPRTRPRSLARLAGHPRA